MDGREEAERPGGESDAPPSSTPSREPGGQPSRALRWRERRKRWPWCRCSCCCRGSGHGQLPATGQQVWMAVRPQDRLSVGISHSKSTQVVACHRKLAIRRSASFRTTWGSRYHEGRGHSARRSKGGQRSPFLSLECAEPLTGTRSGEHQGSHQREFQLWPGADHSVRPRGRTERRGPPK